jgi:chromosomal replication initiation ATPase DnaA
LAAKTAGYSYSAIGRALGGRDKGTIASAIARAHLIASRDADFREDCQSLTALACRWN